jgi:hypothetical protein
MIEAVVSAWTGRSMSVRSWKASCAPSGCDETILSIMLVGADRDAALERALQWVAALS